MSEAASLGIIRDLLALASVALAIALALYAVLRASGGPQWNFDGNVLSRPYGWPDGIAALLLLAFLIWNITAGVPEETPREGNSTELMSEVGLLFSIVLMLVLTLGLLTFIKIRRLNPGEMFGIRQMSLRRAAGLAAISFGLVMLVMVAVIYFMKEQLFGGSWPDTGVQEPVAVFQNAEGVYKVLLALAMVVVVPVYEETVFRGFLYGVIKRFSDRWFAAIFTSLIFACVHRYVGGLVPLFVLAMGFAVSYEMSGCLLVPIMMHAMFNAWQIITMTFVAP